MEPLEPSKLEEPLQTQSPELIPWLWHLLGHPEAQVAKGTFGFIDVGIVFIIVLPASYYLGFSAADSVVLLLVTLLIIWLIHISIAGNSISQLAFWWSALSHLLTNITEVQTAPMAHYNQLCTFFNENQAIIDELRAFGSRISLFTHGYWVKKVKVEQMLRANDIDPEARFPGLNKRGYEMAAIIGSDHDKLCDLLQETSVSIQDSFNHKSDFDAEHNLDWPSQTKTDVVQIYIVIFWRLMRGLDRFDNQLNDTLIHVLSLKQVASEIFSLLHRDGKPDAERESATYDLRLEDWSPSGGHAFLRTSAPLYNIVQGPPIDLALTEQDSILTAIDEGIHVTSELVKKVERAKESTMQHIEYWQRVYVRGQSREREVRKLLPSLKVEIEEMGDNLAKLPKRQVLDEDVARYERTVLREHRATHGEHHIEFAGSALCRPSVRG